MMDIYWDYFNLHMIDLGTTAHGKEIYNHNHLSRW